MFSTLNTIAAKNAVPKPATLKPGTRPDVIISIKAFITKENRPSVIIVIGKLSIVKIGLIIMFTSPITKAAIKAALNPLKLMPANKNDNMYKQNALRTQFTNAFLIKIPPVSCYENIYALMRKKFEFKFLSINPSV